MKVPYNMILKGSDCLPPPPLALIPVRECPPIPTRLAKGIELGVALQLGKSPALSGVSFAKGSINYVPYQQIHLHAEIPFSQITKSNLIGVEVMSRAFEIKYILGDRGQDKESEVIGGNLDRLESVGGWASLYRRRDMRGDTYRQFWHKAKTRDVSYYGVMEDTLVPSDEYNGSGVSLQSKLTKDIWIIKHLDLVLLYPSKITDEIKKIKHFGSKEYRFSDLPISDQVTNYISMMNKAQTSNSTNTVSGAYRSLEIPEPYNFYRPLLVEHSYLKPSSHYTKLGQVERSGYLNLTVTFTILPEDEFQQSIDKTIMFEKQIWGSFSRFHAGHIADSWYALNELLKGERTETRRLISGVYFIVCMSIWTAAFVFRLIQGRLDASPIRTVPREAVVSQFGSILRLCTQPRVR